MFWEKNQSDNDKHFILLRAWNSNFHTKEPWVFKNRHKICGPLPHTTI